ncbi:hypothetical protein B0H17DRAFT_1134644 [Mycena rosella]|uniref:Uncharacterized protein n=1 Tax=Mycena rosella TaxID=1033263 RepID=A0AAD7DFM3_MYCRO|nr:hypothetical protein B0H17DRAFT_1134644 [Mycena rosella]
MNDFARFQRLLKTVIGKTEPNHSGSRNPDMYSGLVKRRLLGTSRSDGYQRLAEIGRLGLAKIPNFKGSWQAQIMMVHGRENMGQSKSVGSRMAPNKPVQSISAATKLANVTKFHNFKRSYEVTKMGTTRASKKLVQVLNRSGFYPSYPFLHKSIIYLSKDSIKVAIRAANDPTKLHLLAYDNFNWMKHAFEVSATHGSVTHDQVLAILIEFSLPHGSLPETAKELSSIDNFALTAGTHHIIPAHQALGEILPNYIDQAQFSRNSTIQVAHILAESVKAWSHHSSEIPKLTDPHALPACKTGEYFLPTYDQEQSSTRHHLKNGTGGYLGIASQQLVLLRFLDVVFRALVLKAAMTVLDLKFPDNLGQKITEEGFMSIATQITTPLLMPSLDRLEADCVKTVPGNAPSGHAVLLMHKLMTLREMRHAIKY